MSTKPGLTGNSWMIVATDAIIVKTPLAAPTPTIFVQSAEVNGPNCCFGQKRTVITTV